MSPLEIKVCPSLLTEGYSSYSPSALKKLFGGKKVSHFLTYNLENQKTDFQQNRLFISISGFQDKYSLVLDKDILRLAEEGEQGQYILKPISDLPKNKEYAPANEHLTMQIAKQVFNIETAENGLIFFDDGTPAYLTKRFDLDKNGEKLAVEDFASILGKSPQTHGEQYKYTGSYIDLFSAIKQHLPAWQVEQHKLYLLILFNYLFSNGDAHLKNFSIIETPQGDFKLAPAYDLMNTRIHIEDADFALSEKIYPKSKGKIAAQFFTLAEEVGISQALAQKHMKKMTSFSDKVIDLVNKSFLSESLKRNYIQSYQTRLNKLKRDL